MMSTYPPTFACPQIEAFSVNVNMGVVRSDIDRGMNKQYRMQNTMPHLFSVRFVMTLKQYGLWQRWMVHHLGEWFLMNLPSMHAGLVSKRMIPHIVRNVSDFEISYVTQEHVAISIQMELHPKITTNLGGTT